MAAPTVSSVTPTNGPTTGGTQVTITGTNFTGATAVTFGGTPATSFTVTTSTQISVATPAHAAGAAQVVVTNPDGASNQLVFFSYQAPPLPTVTTINPTSGPTSGGTQVTITGTNFTGATAVTFGGTPATSFTVTTSTQITAVTPARAAGTAQVVVTTAAGSSSQPVQFTYQAAALPTVTTINPTSGPTSGGTQVTITGTNFTGPTAVTFGDTPATSFTVTTSTQITAATPARAAGAAAVSVTTPVGTSNVIQFFYVNAPLINSLSPTIGPGSGANTVTINGTSLAAVTAVQFGAASASFTITNANQILATAPAAPPGTNFVSVSVVSTGGTSNNVVYNYVVAPVATSLSPALGPEAGGNQVTINGSNLGAVSAVSFGADPATFAALSNSQVLATVPAGTGTEQVVVTTPGGATTGLSYTYVPLP
ncbi:MAG: IPT/TIG domain-containing protein [Pseudonocardiaceae bacterium]